MDGSSQRAGPGTRPVVAGTLQPHLSARARVALRRYSPVGWGRWSRASWGSDQPAPWADLAKEDNTWSMAATSAAVRRLRAAPALPEVHRQLRSFVFVKATVTDFPCPGEVLSKRHVGFAEEVLIQIGARIFYRSVPESDFFFLICR